DAEAANSDFAGNPRRQGVHIDMGAFETGLTAGGLVVPGTANPWLAGMPNGTPTKGDTAPAQSPVLAPIAVVPGNVLRFTATGQVSTNAGLNVGPPDGLPASFAVGDSAAANGMSRTRAPLGALMGVFLDD